MCNKGFDIKELVFLYLFLFDHVKLIVQWESSNSLSKAAYLLPGSS